MRQLLKFWLACFLLLFMGAELLEWVTHLSVAGDSLTASGTWLVLGGMGLAAASNAKHLQKPSQQPVVADCATDSANAAEKPLAEKKGSLLRESDGMDSEVVASEESQSKESQAQNSEQSSGSSVPKEDDIPKEDAILFEMRVPWW